MVSYLLCDHKNKRVGFFPLGLVFKIKGKLPTVKSGHDENGSQYKAFHSQMIQLVLKQPSPSAGSPSLPP